MSTTLSHSPWPTRQSARAAAHACLTKYPLPWAPTMFRAAAAEFSAPPPAAARSAHGRGAHPIKTSAHPLALRVPPLAVAFVTGLAAWGAARAFPGLCLHSASLPPIAAMLGLLGGACSLLGVLSFRRARTTVNPTTPGAATVLVVSGVYRFTRNPMYLGFLLLLLGELAWLGSPLALFAAPAFIAYLNGFQIAPEERALRQRFGAEFNAYAARVPRWL